MNKLIIFFNAHLKIGISGGDERALQMMKSWFSKEHVCASVFTDYFISKELNNRGIKPSYVKIVYFKEIFGTIIEYLLRTAKTIQILRRTDIENSVCYSVSSFLPDIYPGMWCKKHCSSVKWFGLVHHVIKDYKTRPGNKLWNYLAWHEQRYCLKCLKNADKILVVNSEIKKYLLELGIENHQIIVIDNGFDDEEIRSIDCNKKSYEGIYVGRLIEEKGFYDLPDIWKGVCEKNPNARLCIVGYGNEHDVNRVKELFKQYNIRENVEFAGSLKHEDVIKKMKQSHVLVFPSYSESWGMVITEAMACGLPCVTYNIAVFDDIYLGINQAAELHDKYGFTRIINDLLSDSKRAENLGNKGKEFVFSKFTWEKIASNEWKIMYDK